MAELADAKVSKTFGRKPMGVRSPLPAPFEIRHLFATWTASVEDSGAKLCQFCVSTTSEMERRLAWRGLEFGGARLAFRRWPEGWTPWSRCLSEGGVYAHRQDDRLCSFRFRAIPRLRLKLDEAQVR